MQERKIMKRLFLVDLENVGRSFLKGLNNLTQEDSVMLFHAEACGEHISEEFITSVTKYTQNVVVSSMKAHTKNAMDFQLCTYLGYMIAKWGSTTNYYIVSKDKGYLASIEFVKKMIPDPLVINMIPNLEKLNAEKKDKASIEELLDIYPKKVIRITAAGFSESKTLAEYHNYLQANLPKDGSQIYTLTKRLFEHEKM